MNEKITEKILEWMQSAEDVLYEQLPEFAQEVISYGFYSNIFESIVFSTLFIICMAACPKIIKLSKDCVGEVHPLVAIPLTLVAIFSVASLVDCFSSIENLIKISVAPKLYLIERFIK